MCRRRKQRIHLNQKKDAVTCGQCLLAWSTVVNFTRLLEKLNHPKLLVKFYGFANCTYFEKRGWWWICVKTICKQNNHDIGHPRITSNHSSPDDVQSRRNLKYFPRCFEKNTTCRSQLLRQRATMFRGVLHSTKSINFLKIYLFVVDKKMSSRPAVLETLYWDNCRE